MTGFTDFLADEVLNYAGGEANMPAVGNRWLALFTAVGSDAGTGFTEVTGGAYARVQIAGAGTTNATTASGNPTLHFAVTPAWVVPGMAVTDLTSAVIPAGTTILSVTGTTAVMSANATGGGVGNGDSIQFSAFGAASGSAPSSIVNGGVVTFPTATASWGTSLAFGVYDASTSGNLLYWDYLGNFTWNPVTVSSASPGVITEKANGYTVGDNVVFSTEYGGTAPTFSQSNFTGVLVVAHQATDTIDVTNGGTAVNTSSTGSGMVRKIVQQPIAINTTASFAASTLSVTLA
jgi:hypothetical protein